MSEPVGEGEGLSASAENERLRRRLAEVALLGRVAVAANEADDVADALDEGLWLLGRHAGCLAATMWLRQGPAGELEPSRRWFWADVPVPALVEAVDDVDLVPLGSLPGRVEASGAPVWLVGLDRRGHWLRGADDGHLGVAAAFGVPVWVGGDPCGVLAGFYAEARPVDAHLLELLEQVATQLGAAHRRAQRDDRLPRWVLGSSPAEVAHRVRTPLVGVLTPLELLLAVEEDVERRELLGVALDAARELHGVLEDALRGASIPARPAAAGGAQLASMR